MNDKKESEKEKAKSLEKDSSFKKAESQSKNSSKEKRFYRPKDGRVIAGVASGLGKYFEIDPVLFRVLFILFTLAHGSGILVYLILMIATPEEGESSKQREGKVKNLGDQMKEGAQEFAKNPEIKKNWFAKPGNIIGLIIVLIGLWLLTNQLLPINWLRWDLIWPLAIIGIGFYILYKK